MENTGPETLKGHFLMAMPGLNDPNFFQTVTCICEHTEEGAVGMVVNRVHDTLKTKDLFEELNIAYLPGSEILPVYLGGPVHLGEIFILHGPPFDWQGCMNVTPVLAMSNTIDILQAIALGRGPEAFLIAIGCAGWGADQLETEIRENVWLTGRIYEDIIFSTAVESRWEQAIRKIGIDPTWLSDTAGHA